LVHLQRESTPKENTKIEEGQENKGRKSLNGTKPKLKEKFMGQKPRCLKKTSKKKMFRNKY